MKSGAACPTAGVPAGCCSVSNQDPKPRGQRTELDAQTRRSCSERGGQTFFLQVNRQRGDKFRLATSLQPVPELRTGGRWFIKRSRDDTACRERINLRRVQATPGQVTPVAFVSHFDIFYPPRPFWLFFHGENSDSARVGRATWGAQLARAAQPRAAGREEFGCSANAARGPRKRLPGTNAAPKGLLPAAHALAASGISAGTGWQRRGHRLAPRAASLTSGGGLEECVRAACSDLDAVQGALDPLRGASAPLPPATRAQKRGCRCPA